MKRNLKKVFALLLACALIAAIAACGNGDSGTTESPPPGSAPVRDTLNVAGMQDSGTLYPLGVTGGWVGVLPLIYEPLLDTLPSGERVWILATGIDQHTDIHATLHIRQGVKFSNGAELTAEDVMFTMEMCKANPQMALNVKVVDFEKTRVTGTHTIDLWYTEFNASQEVGFSQMWIMHKASFDEVALATTPVGTGPYTVTNYVVNSHLSLTARDDYWQGAPRIQNVNVRVINEDAQRVNALEVGDIDYATIPLKDVEFIREKGYTVNLVNPGWSFVTLFSMLENQPLASKEARWAVCHAIDRQAIADILYYGMSDLTDWPVSHRVSDFEPRFANRHETYSIGYDPARARTLAEQSGLVGQTLRIITNGSQDHTTAAEIIQGNLLAIGVNVDIINYDQATYFPTMMDASNFEIAMFTPGAPSVLGVDILAMYITFIPLGWSGPGRDLYGQLSMGAITTFDERSRSEQLNEAVGVWVDYAPWYSICEVEGARAVNSELRGLQFMLGGNFYYHNLYWG